MLQQIQRHTHRPQTSAQLAQTMSLLHLTAEELRASVEEALANNPALEQTAAPACPFCGKPLAKAGICPDCASPAAGEGVVFTSPAADFLPAYAASAPEEAESAQIPSLAAHLLGQIAADLAAEDRPLAAHLLMGLDEDGLLTLPLAEVAAYFHVPLARVRGVQSLIQRADPSGCASANPQEALQAQLNQLQEKAPAHTTLCLQHFSLLAKGNYPSLAKALQISEKEVEAAARFIGANLNPYPARAYWGKPSAPQARYYNPDVLIRRSGEARNPSLIVEVSQPYAASLRVNPLFRQALKQAEEDKLPAWQEDLQQAQLLVKSVAQRAGALELLMKALAQAQKDFILRGEAYLRPLTRAALATQLGVHESTISRAVAQKTVQLPNGHIVPLSRFFESQLPLRAALRQIIQSETQPLSDQELANRLRLLGFSATRRTVTKYRLKEGILSSYLRPVKP